MDKRLLFVLEKLVWCRLCDSCYVSQEITYQEEIQEFKILGIVIQKHIPAGFTDLYGDFISEDEIKKKHFIEADNTVRIKPYLRLKFQDETYHEEFFDTHEEAKEIFAFINNKLYPDILLCK